MDMWNQKLNRENIEQFYDMYAAFAYKCAYKNLRDTTRAEMCVVEAFIDTYHKRAKLDEENVIYFFSDALQLHINEMAAKYPVANESAAVSKSLDEYTASTMKQEILEKIDSPKFRIAEFVSATPDNRIRRRTPIMEFMQNSGITIILLIKLVVLAIVIAVATYFAGTTLFHGSDYVVSNTMKDSKKLEENIVSALDYLPVSINGYKTEEGEKSQETSQESQTTESQDTSSETAETTKDTEPSATRG
ncbi:MAG: hypothetical protein IKD90_03415 [Clostridiales bacterium]|nr:hypothetical protein [Clostridiales bacterium]